MAAYIVIFLMAGSITDRQAVQEWGIENVGESVRKAYNDSKRKKDEFDCIHAVFPREDYDREKRDKGNMPHASTYISKKEYSWGMRGIREIFIAG